jgi:hypothetical protein
VTPKSFLLAFSTEDELRTKAMETNGRIWTSEVWRTDYDSLQRRPFWKSAGARERAGLLRQHAAQRYRDSGLHEIVDWIERSNEEVWLYNLRRLGG